MRPLLLLDVDGPLNPFAAKADAKPAGFVEHKFRLSGWSRRKPLRMWLNPGHGSELLAAAGEAELVWATTWEHKANTMVGPAIGLPVLPVIEFGQTGMEWKFPAVARYAGDRPVIWLDDDFDMYTTARDEFLRSRAGLVSELIRVDPRTGITRMELAAVRECLG
nr:HAD domain-containing protein [Kibdelosporangium sp. MJ126-NF4]CEL14561.1 putative secreted protein [Kibdelosporangium sp. MJ126-NF4]